MATTPDTDAATLARTATLLIGNVRSHVLAARSALLQARACEEYEFNTNPWMVNDEAMFIVLQMAMIHKLKGLEHWPITKWESNQVLDLHATLQITNELLGILERTRQHADHYHTENPYLQRVLVEPVLGHIELAIGHLRLAAAQLGCLLHDQRVISYTIPLVAMENGC